MLIFSREGFCKCPHQHTHFTKVGNNGKILIASVYVDDLIYCGNDQVMIEDFKKSIMTEFEMTDLRLMYFFLGIEVVQTTVTIFIS